MKITVTHNIGAAIRHHRKRLGISLTAMGEQVGLDNSSLSRIENGKQGVSTELLGKLAAAFGISIEELFNADAAISVQKDYPAVSVAPRQTPAKPWHKQLRPDHVAMQLQEFLPEELKHGAAVMLEVHARRYLCAYMSRRVVVFAVPLNERPQDPVIRPQIELGYPRLFYRAVLAKHYLRDVVPLSSRHYLAAFVGPVEGVPIQIKKEAGTLDIMVEQFPTYASLAARIEELENTPTELDELNAQMDRDYAGTDYTDEDFI